MEPPHLIGKGSRADRSGDEKLSWRSDVIEVCKFSFLYGSYTWIVGVWLLVLRLWAESLPIVPNLIELLPVLVGLYPALFVFAAAVYVLGRPWTIRLENQIERAFGIETERDGKEIRRRTTVSISDPSTALDELEKFITSTLRVREISRGEGLLHAKVRPPATVGPFTELSVELDRHRRELRCETRARRSFVSERGDSGLGETILPLLVSWSEGHPFRVSRNFGLDTFLTVVRAARSRAPRATPAD